jgi:hypothetical protein
MHHFADVYGRKHMLVFGWLVDLPVPFMIAWVPVAMYERR